MAPGRIDLGGGPDHRGLVTDVGLQGQCRPGSRDLADLVHHQMRLLALAREHRHLGAFGSQPKRQCPPNTPPG